MAKPGRELILHACDCRFTLHCSNESIATLVDRVFSALVSASTTSTPAHRSYHVEEIAGGRYRVSSAEGALEFANTDELLFHIDKTITIELQHLRPDLLFVHGAALAWQQRVAVVSAPPGTGKSTLALVALQLGFEYFSDELAPIDLHRLTVYPYPRALYLKTVPPPPHALPGGALNHGGRYHVAAPPGAIARGNAPLAALIFLRRDEQTFSGLRPLTAASGATRLIANTLNLLAHPAAGIDAAVVLSQAVNCFEIDGTNLLAAGESIRAHLSAAP
jgi:hypothetical protein